MAKSARLPPASVAATFVDDSFSDTSDAPEVTVSAQLPNSAVLEGFAQLVQALRSRFGGEIEIKYGPRRWERWKSHADLACYVQRAEAEARQALVSIVDDRVQPDWWSEDDEHLLRVVLAKHAQDSLAGRLGRKWRADQRDQVVRASSLVETMKWALPPWLRVPDPTSSRRSLRLYVARSNATWVDALDPESRASAIETQFGRAWMYIDARRLALASIAPSLAIARWFDRGDSSVVDRIRDDRRSFFDATQAEDSYSFFARRLWLRDTEEIDSEDSLPVQAMDIASGIARRTYFEHGIKAVVDTFHRVIVNGEVLR